VSGALGGRLDARAELEQTLQVRGVAPDPVHLAVGDLEDERRGEDLLDPGRGHAEVLWAGEPANGILDDVRGRDVWAVELVDLGRDTGHA
jgi:hypothetical protein